MFLFQQLRKIRRTVRRVPIPVLAALTRVQELAWEYADAKQEFDELQNAEIKFREVEVDLNLAKARLIEQVKISYEV